MTMRLSHHIKLLFGNTQMGAYGLGHGHAHGSDIHVVVHVCFGQYKGEIVFGIRKGGRATPAAMPKDATAK